MCQILNTWQTVKEKGDKRKERERQMMVNIHMLGFPQDFLRKEKQHQIRAVFRKSMKLLKDFKFIY